ncbi:MAG: accessory factor UbiK family protein [Gammaproteobacteria bacterium]|nr:accessory factor UbiK family protein [Gammaproteobacteria bacterium]NVK86610.1 accessory factor UbiK family protein [Gammaproteobacteria bacterium]
MIDAKIIDEISDKLSQIIPPELKNAQSQWEAKLRAVLQSQLAKLDLVSREEFDIQTKVLHKTRQKLTELEHQVKALEAQLSANND